MVIIMEKKEIQKSIKGYFKKKIWALIFYIVAIPLGIWLFVSTDNFSVTDIKNLGKFVIGLPFAFVFISSRSTFMVRLVMDIVTGYIIDTIIVIVDFEETGWDDVDALKKDVDRYRTIKAKDQNGKKQKFL